MEAKRLNHHPPASRGNLLLLDLNALSHAIGLARVDLLARLGDRPQHLVVGEALVGNDGSGLTFEGDFVRLDACAQERKVLAPDVCVDCA